MPDPTDPNDPRDDNETGGGDGLLYVSLLLAIVVGIFVVVSIAGVFTSRDPVPPTTAMCTESCWGFLKLECPTNRVMIAWVGFPGCGGTPHVCGRDK